MLLHNQSNPSRWATGCLSTRCVHIHRPGSTNGLFVLHFLTAAHRQECLRGERRRLAGPPPSAAAGLLSQHSRNPARGLMPKPNGSAEFRGLAGRTREAIKADYGPTVLEDYSQGAKICGQPAQLYLAYGHFLSCMISHTNDNHQQGKVAIFLVSARFP